MNDLNRRACVLGAAALWAAARATPAAAETYPDHPLRVIVPYAAGGASDTLARLLADILGGQLGQTLVVENRGGGASVVGTQAIGTARPDGYTIGVIDSAFVINPGLFGSRLPYDTVADFAPVSLVARSPLVLAVHPSVPATTAQELVALAKARPGSIAFGSAGLGTAIHLAGEQFIQTAGVEIIHVPYRGGAPSIVDLIAGQVQMTFSTVPSILGHVRSGRVRALAVTGLGSELLPEVPTMAQAGLPGVDAAPLFGMVAPANTPPAALARLASLTAAAVTEGPLRRRLIELGFEPVGSTPEAFRATIAEEVAKWTRVIQAGNIKVD
ncbi:tripartite-type tricarboxylate transporter receptor subunit TctC [Humitalea rosea]|uniref:Tripartite-type tricarboxylate transporter receptor subunit TctC n=1 Tax=Humitalea rosea TaxID=990373 RepID=A0A2W7IK91_9PROT|nr:tripartite tricarboxylate transporter substrate binding protein [Humitalea rosea]PZW45647.1 tripartite-type tricarboxylate transporter receptor subunit TctC [Humitalea rosea]